MCSFTFRGFLQHIDKDILRFCGLFDNLCDFVFHIREFGTLRRADSVTFHSGKVTKTARSKGEMARLRFN